MEDALVCLLAHWAQCGEQSFIPLGCTCKGLALVSKPLIPSLVANSVKTLVLKSNVNANLDLELFERPRKRLLFVGLGPWHDIPIDVSGGSQFIIKVCMQRFRQNPMVSEFHLNGLVPGNENVYLDISYTLLSLSVKARTSGYSQPEIT